MRVAEPPFFMLPIEKLNTWFASTHPLALRVSAPGNKSAHSSTHLAGLAVSLRTAALMRSISDTKPFSPRQLVDSIRLLTGTAMCFGSYCLKRLAKIFTDFYELGG
jgi:hypothetical protein